MYDFIKEDFEFLPDVVNLRGFIISKAITIEYTMEVIIISYFMEDDSPKISNFRDDILLTLTYSKKVELLSKVIDHMDIAEKVPSINELKGVLTSINKLRNKVAHQNWGAVGESEVHFINKSDGDGLIVTENDMKDFLNKCEKAKTIMDFVLGVCGYWDKFIPPPSS